MNAKLRASAGSIFVMCTLGTMYAFSSLFVKAIGAMNGTNELAAIVPFMCVTLCMGLGDVTSGFVLEHVGSRRLAIAGISLWALGNIVAGIGLPFFGTAWMIAFYSVIGGFGCGLAYVATVSDVISHYPSAKGLGGAIAVTGFGLGAGLYAIVLRLVPLYANIPAYVANVTKWSPTVQHDLASMLGTVFIVSGVAFAAIGIPGALMLTRGKNEGLDAIPKMSLAEIFNTSDVYVMWGILFLNVAGGLYVLTNVVSIINVLTAVPVATVVGLYAIISLANGLGRPIAGALSDAFGRRSVFIGMFALQFVVLMLLDTPIAANFYVSLTLVTIVLLCYGAGFAALPALCADTVGMRNFAPTYGMVLTGWGLAGCVTPYLAVYARSSNVASMLEPIDLVLGVAMILPFLVSIQTQRSRNRVMLSTPSTSV